MVLIICCTAGTAHGQDSPFESGWIYGVGLSAHADSAFADGYAAHNTNNIHPLVGWQNDYAGAYVFVNTYNDVCLTAGKRWVKKLHQKGRLSLSADAYLGGVIGYGQKLPNFAGNFSLYGWIGLGAKYEKHSISLRTTGNIGLLVYSQDF